MTRLVLALVLVGCAADTPIPVYSGTLPAADRLLLEEAAGILGYGVEWRRNEYGSIQLDVIGQGSAHELGHYYGAGCVRFGWAERDVLVIAHELGHALGWRGHVGVAGNLMFPRIQGIGDEITPLQHYIFDSGRDFLRMCGGR